MTQTVLHIDSSARLSGSVSRDLTAQVVERLGAKEVIRRDLATPLPLLDEAWIGQTSDPTIRRRRWRCLTRWSPNWSALTPW